jgi:hypothetical protein
MIPIPAYIDPEAWAGFVDMRRSMPKSRPFTHRAAVLILKELQTIKDAGHCPNAALDQSTLKGWTDVYPVKTKEIERAKVVESTADYVARKAREKADSDAQRSAAPVGIFDAVKQRIALRRIA